MKFFLLFLLLCLFAGCTNIKPVPGQSIRVMTYNIHHGEGTDGIIDLKRIAALIKKEKADIVALQELDRGVARTNKRDLPSELSKLTGMKYFFANNHPYQGGEYGNMVLTRFPILKQTNTHYKMLRTGEQRGVLQLILDVNGKELLFMNTHVDYRPEDDERLINADELEKILSAHPTLPTILCGDFNDTPGSRLHVRMQDFLIDSWEKVGAGEGFSFPSDNPIKRIDYIWISKNGLVKPVEMWVPRSPASDHLPVVGDFFLR